MYTFRRYLLLIRAIDKYIATICVSIEVKDDGILMSRRKTKMCSCCCCLFHFCFVSQLKWKLNEKDGGKKLWSPRSYSSSINVVIHSWWKKRQRKSDVNEIFQNYPISIARIPKIPRQNPFFDHWDCCIPYTPQKFRHLRANNLQN